ncbi:carbohydrate ABC transporter permease [Petrotoga sp. 9PWA.NaAc.5.4]|uniref:carbohydrate ABC transporter permease n=1 Tax=Petrotoga sp. 9PWA.NaAc.5.4 TaxID=1434328 RepID=UPI000EFB14E0|nr:carbohydrate ABC transporter permease [Petrotoga sp. 9PWA.NaAc.5.4]
MKKSKLLTWIAIIIIVIYVFPIFWMIISSFKSDLEILTQKVFPSKLNFGNYTYIFKQSGVLNWLLNSTFVSLISTFGVVIITVLAAYSLGRLKYPGNKFLFYITLAGIMIPLQAIMIPRYLLLRDLNLLNKYWGLIIPYMVNPMFVLIVSQFFKGIPNEFEEAARIDGAGELYILFRIMVPLAKPSLVAIAVFSFVSTWNDFLWPLIVMTDQKMYTLPVGLATFYGSYTMKYGVTMAGNVIAALPIFIFFMIFQEQLIQGLTVGGLKE